MTYDYFKRFGNAFDTNNTSYMGEPKPCCGSGEDEKRSGCSSR